MSKEVRSVKWEELCERKDGEVLRRYFLDEKEPYTGEALLYNKRVPINIVDLRIQFLNGLKHGLTTIYDFEGKELEKEWYKQGVQVVSMNEINADELEYEQRPLGKVIIRKKNGRLYTGQVIKDHGTDKISRTFYVKKGLLHGPSIRYYDDGRVKEEENFRNGNKHGWQTTYLDTEIVVEEFYKRGVKHGFHDTSILGKHVMRQHWHNGQLFSTTKYNREFKGSL